MQEVRILIARWFELDNLIEENRGRYFLRRWEGNVVDLRQPDCSDFTEYRSLRETTTAVISTSYLAA